MRTRYVLENGWWSCPECHKKYDDNREFRFKLINILIGTETYFKLRDIADGKKTVRDCGYTEVN